MISVAVAVRLVWGQTHLLLATSPTAHHTPVVQRNGGGFGSICRSLSHSLVLAGFDGGDDSFPDGHYLLGSIHYRTYVLVGFISFGQPVAGLKSQLSHFITMQS